MAAWLLFTSSLMPWPAGGPQSPATAFSVVRGKVVDAATGRPIAGRVSIRSEGGTWHFPESDAPGGSAVPYRRTAIGHPEVVEMHTTLSAHPFRVQLPPGRYTLTVERGMEYLPERRDFTVTGEPVRLDVRLRRWVDMAARGWYSGDTHTHRTLAELPGVMAAEDLNVAFPLTDWVREAYVPPVAKREASFEDPGPSPIRVDAIHLIVPRNTEYELFTVGGKGHTLGRSSC